MDAMSPDSTVFRSRALFISYSESEKIWTRPYRWPLFFASRPKLAAEMMEIEGFGGDVGIDDGGNGTEGAEGVGGAAGIGDGGNDAEGTGGTGGTGGNGAGGAEGTGAGGAEGTGAGGAEGTGARGAEGTGGGGFDGSLCDDINDSTSSIPLTIIGS
jgi:hypothetical protein